MDKDLIYMAINAGRMQMKTEIMESIFKLVEEYSQNQNEEMVKTLYWIHQLIKSMPVRTQDKEVQVQDIEQ
jgi:hypothetical protein